MGEQAPGIWRFGAVELDERLAALRVAGQDVPLDRSSYDILLALLRHSGEVVTKDELLDAGWPGRVVSENSLAKAVSRLRQALGDDAAALRVVHGYGYRLAAAVRCEAPDDAPPETAPAAPAGLQPGDPLPQRPGWRLERRIGQGATGVIWLAAGDDGEQRAVKFANGEDGVRGLKREIALSRYLRSVRADFAAVAPVLGWNLAHAPYFLELPWYAHGSLRDWAAAQGGLSQVPRVERLRLAIDLCDAVAALHEVGIIHRDLKPENIFPVPDAGAAGGWRVVLGDLGASDAAASPQLAALGITMSVLDSGAMDDSPRYPGSLLYIAPEVVARESPTQRSDVFALGVLAFQLAVGDLRRTLAPGWEADVGDPLLCEDISLAAAASPTRREIDAHGLAERLRTLETRRERRNADLWQAAELARQSRQLARLNRRRRWVSAGTAALSAVLALSLWQQHRVGRAHALAEASAIRANAQGDIARAVVDFLTHDVLQQGNPFARDAAPQTMREALDRAAGTVDQRFADQPGVAAAIHGTLGGAYEGLNDFERAVSHFDRQLAALRVARPVDRAAVAAASADLCTAWHWQGDLTQAWASCRQARADALAAGQQPDKAEVFLSLAESREGRYRDALDRLQPRMARIRNSGDPELKGYALNFAAIYVSALGQLAEYGRLTGELLELRESGGDSMDLAWALADHGNALLLLGRTQEGRGLLLRARAMFEKVGGAAHPHRAVPMVQLASHLMRQERWEEALALSRPTYEALLQETGWQNWTIYAALQVMEAEARLGHRAAAAEVIAAFEEMAAQGLDRDFPYLREPHWRGMARTWLALGDADRSRTYVDRLATIASEPDARPLVQGEVACLRGELARLRGDRASAREHAGECRRLIAAVVPEGSAPLWWPERLMRATTSPREGAATAAP